MTRKQNLHQRFSVLFLLWFLCFLVRYSWWLLDADARRNVEGSKPSNFFVAVINEDKAQILRFSEIENWIRNNPKSTFLIPQEKAESLQQNVSSVGKTKSSFAVKQISEQEQEIELRFVDDDGVTICWYNATEKAVRPKFYKSYGGAFVLLPIFYSFVIALLVALPIHLCYFVYKSRRNKTLS